MAKTKRRVNYPRPKVPARVWVASWGYRESEPSAYVVMDEQYSYAQAQDLLSDLIEEWVDNEEQYLAENETVDVVSFGPFQESYIRVMKDLPKSERPHVERDLRVEGFAYLPSD